MTKAQRRIAIACVLSFSFCFINLYSIGPLMGSIASQLGLTSTQMGLYTTFYFIGYLMSQIPGGLMADRFQPKRILFGSASINAVMTVSLAFAPSFSFGLFFRFVSGLASGCVMASCAKFIASEFPPEKRSEAMGLVLASPPLGILIANTVITRLNSAAGWRLSLALLSLLSIVVIFFVQVFLPKIEISHRKGISPFAGLRSFVGDKKQLILAVGGAFFMFVVVGFGTWANSYASSLGLDQRSISIMLICYSVCAVTGAATSGFLAKAAKAESHRVLLCVLPLMAMLSAIFGAQSGILALTIASGIYGFVSYLPSTHFTSLAMRQAGERYAATAASTQNLFLQTGALIMPVIIGNLIDITHGYSVIWWVFSGMCLISGALCFWGTRDYAITFKTP